jgi:O-antigen/teichoic acid export membrane protein
MPNLRTLIDLLTRKLPAVRLYVATSGSLMIGIGAQSVGFVVLARFLGTEQFGHLMTITAVTNLGSVWSGLGSGEAMRRRVGRDASMYPTMLGHGLILIFASGLALTAILTVGMAMFIHVVPDRGENLQILLLFAASSLIPYAWVLLVEQIFLARREYFRANFVNSGFGLARAFTAVLACIGFGVDDIHAWAVWSAAGYLVVALVCALAIWSYGAPRWHVQRDELPLGISLSVSSFFIVLRHNIDILAIGFFLPATFVGVYGVAKRLVMATFVIGGAFDRLIYNRLALAGKDGPSKTLPLARKYVVYAIGIGAATSVALFLVAPFLPWIFGKDFGESIVILRILCWVLIPIGIQNVAFDALGAADLHRARMVVGAVITVVGAGLIVGLTYGYGTFGTFFAIYATDILMAAAFWLALLWQSERQVRLARAGM